MKKTILAAALAAIFPIAASAVPAKRGPIVFTQPDGSTVALQKIGDERAHMVLTVDGYPVVTAADGFYHYADFGADGALKATSVRVGGNLSAADMEIVKAIDKSRLQSAFEARYEASPMSVTRPVDAAVGSRSANSGIGLSDDAFYGRKELKGLVILAEYKDVKFSEGCDREFFSDMLNSEGFDLYGASGSARDYFIDSSMGQFVPEFDVYGPVKLSKPMDYYGANNASGSDKNAAQMIYDACVGLDDEIDFSEYDLDGDGYVDNVFVFYAGYGEATYGPANSIWPHQWSLSYGSLELELDGVKIEKYACSNELEKDANRDDVPCGIGTFVHEFSHVLGLPDLYVTSGTFGEWTPGSWDVLDQGPYNNNGRTPPAYSAYARNALGWIDLQVLDNCECVELEALNESNRACVIQTESENEFFLFENRQQTGWDKYLPGHGMLVWHIDYNKSAWTWNAVNTQRQHNYVDIEEARGSWVKMSDFTSDVAYNQALADYAFPGSLGVTSFTDNTTPSMKTWSGKKLGLPITEIEEVDGVIRFNVAGGRCDAAVPVVKEPSAMGENWFEAAWEPSEGAAGYLLSVRAYIEDAESVVETADFTEVEGAVTLPAGWSLLGGAGALYYADGSYGEALPSLKLSKSGMGLMTRKYDTDVESVKFWLKGYSTNSASKVTVEGLLGADWIELGSTGLDRTTGVTHTFDDITEGVRQVRLTYSQSLGNGALDDFMVSASGVGYKKLEGYDMLPVGDVCNYTIDRLLAGVKTYEYKVCSLDGAGRRSSWSETQIVTMGDGAGIGDVECGAAESVAVSGSSVSYQGAPGTSVRLIDPTGRIVVAATADGSGCAILKAPASGLYIVATPGGARKVIVR